jgi:hypothetical protein
MRQEVLSAIKSQNIQKVFLVGRWDYYINEGDTDGSKMKLSVSNGIFDGINRDDDMLMFGIKIWLIR